MTSRALLFLLSGVLLAGPAPRFDKWRTIGPGGAGGMFLPTVSPHNPKTVFEFCDMTGAYLSSDAGRSWRMFNLRGTLTSFAFDPKDAKAMYAGNQALWQSLDGGKTWRMILPDPKRDTVEHMRDDHAGPVLTTTDPAYIPGRVHFIAVDPADSNIVSVLLAGKNGTRLVSSRDRGRHWTSLRDFAGPLNVHAMYFDRGLKLVTDSGVLAISGEERQAAGLPGRAVRSASGGRGLLYLTSDTGIHISPDGGRTWRTVVNPLPGNPRFLTVACSENHPETAYVAFVNMRVGSDSFFGIAETTDAGRHWTPVYQEAHGKPARNVERAWIEDFYGGTGAIRDMGVSPNDPNVCYVTDSCPRSFRTLDGGNSWQQIIAEHVADDRWTTTGFDVTTCYGVHFDPFNVKNMFISYTDVGLFKSSDAGETWKSAIKGIRKHWDNTTYWVEFDPKVKGLMWGAFARTHDLPRPKMWRRRGANPDDYQGGIATSTDGGETWTVTVEGMPETAVTHILLDPASPVGRRTLYACGFGRGVYKSTDNGKSWTLKNTGIDKKQPFAWRTTRANDGTLYLVVSRRSEGGYTGDAEDGAIYKSTDGAENWVKMKLPEGVNGPNGLTLDPQDNSRMYLAAWGVQLPGEVRGGGVYLSTDAGQTWRGIFNTSQHVYDVTVDPRNPNVIYNAGFETGAYRSTDRGATWSRIRGFNFKWGHRVIPDPVDASRIYVTTFGGSVWLGPAAGDPQAVEDIVTPVPVAP